MDASNELFHFLRNVRSLEFIAHSSSGTGWNGAGAGTVVVDVGEGVIIFNESGAWQPTDSTPLQFRNVYRWTRLDADLVRLEHLRFGADHPVVLFDLAPGGGKWKSVTPHLCHEDCYTAQLEIHGDVLHVHWAVIGPRKHESIEYTYRHAEVVI